MHRYADHWQEIVEGPQADDGKYETSRTQAVVVDDIREGMKGDCECKKSASEITSADEPALCPACRRAYCDCICGEPTSIKPERT